MQNKPLKILVADDEDGIRVSLACILEMEGHEVLTSTDGHEAIEQVKQHIFDIAFLDLRMPGKDGLEVFAEIKKVSPRTIVILTTALAINDLIRDALKNGVYACIEKPYEIDEILDIIKKIT